MSILAFALGMGKVVGVPGWVRHQQPLGVLWDSRSQPDPWADVGCFPRFVVSWKFVFLFFVFFFLELFIIHLLQSWQTHHFTALHGNPKPGNYF